MTRVLVKIHQASGVSDGGFIERIFGKRKSAFWRETSARRHFEAFQCVKANMELYYVAISMSLSMHRIISDPSSVKSPSG